MGQSECLILLEEKGGWMTTKQICKKLGQIPALVIRSLNKLSNQGEILRYEGENKYTGIKWKYKD